MTTMEDESAIREMIATYSYTWDSNDPDGWANVFTDDGVWESYRQGSNELSRHVASRTELRKFAFELMGRSDRGQRRHFQTGTLFLELTGEMARTRTMVLVTRFLPEEQSASIQWTGIYIDDWQKTRAGWRIAKRVFHMDRMP